VRPEIRLDQGWGMPLTTSLIIKTTLGRNISSYTNSSNPDDIYRFKK
jgi:hypothetical protein